MKNLKKISTFGIMILFLVSFVGVEFYKHYCACDGNVDISVYYEDSCCSESEEANPDESCCTDDQVNIIDCDMTAECDTEVKSYEIDSDFIKTQILIPVLEDIHVDLFNKFNHEIKRNTYLIEQKVEIDVDIGSIIDYILAHRNRCSIKTDNEPSIS